jgi:hypothetical protein
MFMLNVSTDAESYHENRAASINFLPLYFGVRRLVGALDSDLIPRTEEKRRQAAALQIRAATARLV